MDKAIEERFALLLNLTFNNSGGSRIFRYRNDPDGLYTITVRDDGRVRLSRAFGQLGFRDGEVVNPDEIEAAL